MQNRKNSVLDIFRAMFVCEISPSLLCSLCNARIKYLFTFFKMYFFNSQYQQLSFFFTHVYMGLISCPSNNKILISHNYLIFKLHTQKWIKKNYMNLDNLSSNISKIKSISKNVDKISHEKLLQHQKYGTKYKKNCPLDFFDVKVGFRCFTQNNSFGRWVGINSFSLFSNFLFTNFCSFWSCICFYKCFSFWYFLVLHFNYVSVLF